MMFLYRAVKVLLFPLIFLIVAWRMYRGKEEREHFHERLGQTEAKRPTGKLIWLHGASVGEVVSLLPVITELRIQRPTLPLLLTTGTTTGREMLSKFTPTLPGTGPLFIQYAPLDTNSATTAFLKHWQPTLSVFTESEFWPELLSKAPRPILVNGRISNRSWPRYQRYSWFFKPLLKRFELMLAQSQTDVERLKALGGKQVYHGGNLKFDSQPLPADETQLEKFKQAITGRPVLVVASTHPGEEEMAAQIHMALKPSVPELLTIVVPRHPHRGTQAANEAMRHTKAVKRRGLGELPALGGNRHTDVYVADTLGELGLWYRLATVAVIGGSLVKHGGHNPLEPLKLGIPTFTGPHMHNFQDMVPTLTEQNLLTVAPNLQALTKSLQNLLANPEELNKQHAHIKANMPKLGGSAKLSAHTLLHLLGPLDK